MKTIVRNVMVLAAITVAWIFLFVPNPLLNMLNVPGLENRLNFPVLFGVLPLVLAAISMFTASGALSTRITLTLLVPILAVATCLSLWLTGIYSPENLLGAWLYCLPPMVAYIVGILFATLLLRRSGRDSIDVQPPAR